MAEKWLPVVGYEGLYEVSNKGRIKSFHPRQRHKGGILNLNNTLGGAAKGRSRDGEYYKSVVLTKNKIHTTKLVHILVLESFRGLRPKNNQCRHLNDIKSDNRLKNLIWGTSKENHADRKINGGMIEGEDHHNSKLTEKQVIWIKKNILKYSYKFIATKYNVNQITIKRIHLGVWWKHIEVNGFEVRSELKNNGKTSKATLEMATEIIKLHKKGMSASKLRYKFGVDYYIIKKILSGTYISFKTVIE